MRILIDGHYGMANLGDDLILVTLVELLNEEGYNRIKVIHHGSRILKTSNLHYDTLILSKNTILKLLQIIVSVLSSDVIIIGGGGLFPSGFNKRIYFITSFAKLLRKKVILFGVGIDKIKNNQVKYWGKMIERLDLFTVRDNYSRDIINHYYPNKILVMADIIFARNRQIKSQNKSNIILSLAMPFSDKELKIGHFATRYNDFLIACGHMLNELRILNKNLVMLIFDSVRDKILLDNLSEKGYLQKSDLIITPDFNNIFDIYDSAYITISMRYHSLLMSIYSNTPTLSLSYAPKAHQLLIENNMSYLSIVYGIRSSEFFGYEKDIDIDEVDKKIEYIISNYTAIKTKIIDVNAKLHEKSSFGFEILLKNLKEV